MQYSSKDDLLEYLSTFDAKKYASTRNYIDGWVSKLSPYITHGVISTKQCVEKILERYSIKEAEKFLMELVWKEFFLQVQKVYGNSFLDTPIREDKTSIPKTKILPSTLVSGTTNTSWINETVITLNQNWWLHNHKRMWLASRCCHRAKLDWKRCADRTYYHFVDGELSANHLSRQWVNSTFANKAYFMNEDNLQKYRPWTSDPDLRGTYDQISQKIFDPARDSRYQDDSDISETLITPIDLLDTFDISCTDNHSTLRLLSPWRLDETLLADEIPTVIILDRDFTNQYPRSAKRLAFIREYTSKYKIAFVWWSYQDIIDQCLEHKLEVLLDERRDPVYREVQKTYLNHDWVTILPYNRINTWHPEEPIMKFFKYWNKTTRFIKEMIHD